MDFTKLLIIKFRKLSIHEMIYNMSSYFAKSDRNVYLVSPYSQVFYTIIPVKHRQSLILK